MSLLGRGLSSRDFIEIYYSLNRWEWDDRIGPEPHNFETMTHEEMRSVIRPIMQEIRTLTSEYERLRYANVECGYLSFENGFRRMTPKEFDDWFVSDHQSLYENHLDDFGEKSTGEYAAKKRKRRNKYLNAPVFLAIFFFLFGVALGILKCF